ncbi:hypothetical protein ACFFSW_05215 [Saccharothrix longispora]|uniref:STAS domain-containing protein n=1 Tax=Saccharothrix longispora TaxID=33920 RepID=A0ABU1PRK0_9PSEU|nr:hypothetical protein [Saccharothrix longispora]MDR6593216.1 hypothetical protein [Saccharothrix longispora]
MDEDLLHVRVFGQESVSILHLSGLLVPGNYASLRDVLLMTALAEPAAIVADLTGLRVAPPLASSVFRVVRDQVASWPGVPILLTGAEPGAVWDLPCFDTVEEAVASVGPPPRRWVVRVPLPRAGAPVFARLAAEEACRVWSLERIGEPAAGVAAGLVDLVDRGLPRRPTIAFEWWRDLFVIAVGDDVPVRCDSWDLRRAVAAAPDRTERCGWSTTWTDGTLIWAVLRA